MARLTINLDDRTHRALEETAARQKRSMDSIILLLENPPAGVSVISPRHLVDAVSSPKET